MAFSVWLATQDPVATEGIYNHLDNGGDNCESSQQSPKKKLQLPTTSLVEEFKVAKA